jgi:hypothetical protein
MDWSKPSQLTRLLGILLSTAAPLASAQAQNYGRVGAVNLDATGTPPGGTVRTLTIGASIVAKERIRTSSAGATQILFPDQSTLNVGANSDLVIDEFVYNPNSKTGSMVASATKGVLRFVGGQISHNQGATLNTPSGSLGIRGGIVTVMLPLPPNLAASDPALAGLHGELVIAHFGFITLKNNVSQVVIRPGFAVVLGGPNQPIPTPVRLSDATLQLIMTSIRSHSGQTGGATTIPTNNSASLPPGFGATFLHPPMHPPGTDPLGYTSIFGAGTSVSKNKSQTNQTQTATPPSYP